MNPQATTTDELTFTRPQGELEKQVLTAEAVEFLTELVTLTPVSAADRPNLPA